MTSESMRRAPLWQTALLALLAFLPLLLTLGIVWRTQVPIPHMDDYDAILQFGNRYVRLPDAAARLWYVVDATHVQYKLIVLHTLVATDLGLTGKIHLAFLQWWGDLSLLAVAWCLWRLMPEGPLARRLLLFVPVSLLVAVLRDYEALGWAMGCLQQLGALAWVLLALHFFQDGRRSRFALGCAAYAMAMWSSLNGVLLFPLGVLLMLQQKRVKRVWALVAMTAFLAFTYIHGYTPGTPPNPPHPASAIIMPAFYVAVLGDLLSRVWLAALAGLLLLLAALPALRRVWHTRQLDGVSAGIIFLLLNAALITVGRYRFTLDAALPSRYTMYSQVFAALVYIEWIRRSKWRSPERGKGLLAMPGAWWAVVAVVLVVFAHYERLGARFSHDRQVASTTHLSAWEHYGPAMSLVSIEEPEVQCNFQGWMPHASEALATSTRLGIYTPPPEPTPPLPPSAYAIATACSRPPLKK